jgi:hypothetical protein
MIPLSDIPCRYFFRLPPPVIPFWHSHLTLLHYIPSGQLFPEVLPDAYYCTVFLDIVLFDVPSTIPLYVTLI